MSFFSWMYNKYCLCSSFSLGSPLSSPQLWTFQSWNFSLLSLPPTLFSHCLYLFVSFSLCFLPLFLLVFSSLSLFYLTFFYPLPLLQFLFLNHLFSVSFYSFALSFSLFLHLPPFFTPPLLPHYSFSQLPLSALFLFAIPPLTLPIIFFLPFYVTFFLLFSTFPFLFISYPSQLSFLCFSSLPCSLFPSFSLTEVTIGSHFLLHFSQHSLNCTITKINRWHEILPEINSATRRQKIRVSKIHQI